MPAARNKILNLPAYLLVILILFDVFGKVEKAWSIPVFARKYRTSCVTCHSPYPKLTAFGEAFRLNGYQIPGDDEAYVEEIPVSLGAEAYKKVFPEAVWPGAIPEHVPLGLRVSSRADLRPHHEEGGLATDFVAPDSLSLLLGGTIGEDISFYGDIGLYEGGDGVTDIGRLFLQFDSLFEERYGRGAFNVKVGRFEPAAVPFSSHRRLGISNYAVNAFTLTTPNLGLVSLAPADGGHDDEHKGEDHHDEIDYLGLRRDYVSGLPQDSIFGGGGHHGSGLSLGRSQSGIEINGILNDRFFYGFGLVNGNGTDTSEVGFDNNSNKDFYLRLSYKYGGMPLTGESSEEDDGDDFGGSSKNWRDDSIKVGFFAWFGDADDTEISGFIPGTNTFLEGELGKYQRLGLDLSVYRGDVNLFGAYMWGKDDLSLRGAANVHEDGDLEPIEDDHELASLGFKDHEFDVWFVQAEYVKYPWLVPYIRYDYISRDMFGNTDRIVPGAAILLRANLKVTLESQIYPGDTDSNLYQVALDYAF